MPTYTPKQKESAVLKLLKPGGPSALALSGELGISQTSLSRWLREHKASKGITMAKRPLDWTAEERFQAVMESSVLSDEELGTYVRKKGITRQQLQEWKNDCIQAMGDRTGRKPDPEKRDMKREIKQLKREVRQKEKALAETAALLVLKKKPTSYGGKTRTANFTR